MVYFPLPFGHLISHLRLDINMSGVFVPRVRIGSINTMLRLCLARIFAVSNSLLSGGADNCEMSIFPKLFMIIVLIVIVWQKGKHKYDVF